MNLQQQITQIRGQFQAVALHLGKLGTSINTLATMMGGGHAPSRVGIVPAPSLEDGQGKDCGGPESALGEKQACSGDRRPTTVRNEEGRLGALEELLPAKPIASLAANSKRRGLDAGWR